MSGYESISDSTYSRNIWDIVEVAAGIGHLIVYRRRDDPVQDGKGCRDCLENSACCNWLTDHRFDRTYGDRICILAKRKFECIRLCAVVILHRVSMSIDVINVMD